MLDKLSVEQKERLESLCEHISDIFEEEDNGFTKDTISEWYESKLYRGIVEVMEGLGRWC